MKNFIALICLLITFKVSAQSPEALRSVLDRYEVTKPVEMKREWSGWRYRLYKGKIEISDPFTAQPYEMKFKFFQSRKRGKRPTLFILPPIGGETLVDKYLGRYFANRGYHAIIGRISDNLKDTKRPIEDIDNFLARTNYIQRSLINYFASRGDVDENRLAAFGASLGGLRLAFTMASEPKLKAGILYVAGNDVPYTMSNSNVDIVENWRIEQMKNHKMTSQREFYLMMKDEMKLDISDITKDIDRKRIMMKVSLRDLGVPTKTQVALYEELGRPRTDFVFLNHRLSVASALFSIRRMKRFIEKRFSEVD